MKVTNSEFKMTFQGEEITVPAGLPITHQTAMGIDMRYNFIDSLGWMDKDYSHLKHDARYRGINVPVEYITEK